MPHVFDAVLATAEKVGTSTTQRMLSVKLVQRIGLTFLQPRNQQWRYKRSLASLEDNLAGRAAEQPHVGVGGAQEDGAEVCTALSHSPLRGRPSASPRWVVARRTMILRSRRRSSR